MLGVGARTDIDESESKGGKRRSTIASTSFERRGNVVRLPRGKREGLDDDLCSQPVHRSVAAIEPEVDVRQ